MKSKSYKRKHYNYEYTPLMRFIAHGGRWTERKAIFDFLIEIRDAICDGCSMFARGSKKGPIESPDDIEKSDLSYCFVFFFDKENREVMEFALSWWGPNTWGLSYPSLTVNTLKIFDYSGDWRQQIAHFRTIARIVKPLWAEVYEEKIIGEITGKCHGEHVTKIPALGVVNYFGKGYLDGLFGGLDRVVQALGPIVEKDGDGVWLTIPESVNDVASFLAYRKATQKALLDADVWGDDAKDSFHVKEHILKALGFNVEDYETPQFLGAMIEVVKEIKKRIDGPERNVGSDTPSKVRLNLQVELTN